MAGGLMKLRRFILLVKRASRFSQLGLILVIAALPFLGSPISAQTPQPPLSPGPPQNQLPVVQPPTPVPTSEAPAPSISSMPSPTPGQQPGASVTNPPGNNRPEPPNTQQPSAKRGEVSFNFDDADVYLRHPDHFWRCSEIQLYYRP